MWRLTCALAAAFAALAMLMPAAARAATVDLGKLANAETTLPDGPASAVVFLFSPAAGIGSEERGIARALRLGGAAVVTVDLPRTLEALDEEGDDCLYLVDDLERIGHEIGRQTGATQFRAPVLAGQGAGGALVIDLLAQTPEATLGAVVAVDPDLGSRLARPLCTPAERVSTPAGQRYVLPKGPLPAPLTVIESEATGPAGQARVLAMTGEGTTFALEHAAKAPGPALLDGIDKALAALEADTSGLPLTELPAKATRDTLAVVLSGDGGWRDLDRSIAEVLQAEGVPTVGLDSLRYFWSRRTPEETARDLAGIIETYTRRWQVGHVLLIGYSFGADVLPATYAGLPPATQARIVEVALLGLAGDAQWEITVTGWLGGAASDTTPTLPAAEALPPALVQCFFGKDEDDTVCPKLAASGIEVIETAGGHHFDGDYAALAHRILAGLDARLEAPAAAAPP